MVYVNDYYPAAIHGSNLQKEWSGVITLKNGSEIPFDMSNIKSGTGELTMRCSSDSSIDLGGGYASELVVSLKKIDIDRYLLIDGIIELQCTVIQQVESRTWGDLADDTWSDVSSQIWGGADSIRFEIPMGLYIIKEAMRTSDSVKITAYDFMILLDKALPSSFTEASRTVYDWLTLVGTACSIGIGSAREDLRRLPNGNRVMDFGKTNTEVKTYRDLVIQLASAVAAVAVIDRAGQLVFRPYGAYAQDGVSASDRYSSEFSEYQSYYTGLYATYLDENVTEYHRNTTEQQDTGLVINLGINPFLQITTEAKRKAAGQAIIDSLKDLKYVPFKVSMPFNPAYEPMDVLRFYENQTQVEDTAPITKVVFRVNDKMQISCGGENPALNEVSTRESKAIERVSSDLYSSDVFWMVMDNAPEEATVTVPADTPTKIGEALFYAKEELNMLQITYTATYTLEKTALVEIEVFIDEVSVYKTQENQFPEENRLTVTTGAEIRGKESHKVEIYVTVTEATLDIGGGGVRMELRVEQNSIYDAETDFGVYGFSKVTAVVPDDIGYYAQATAVDVPVSPATVNGDVLDDLSFGTVTGMSLPPTYDVSQGFLEYINPHLSDFHIILANWAYQLTDKFEFVYRMVSNPNTMGNWPSILGTSQSASAEMFLQYNFWAGRTVMNIAYHGSWAGDGNMSYETPYDYENYYKIAADGGTFTLYKGPSRDNISTVCFQKVFPTGAVPIDAMVTLFPLQEGRLDMEFCRLKVWDENDQLLHDYRPIPDGICDAVTHYKFMATTTGHINGPPAN